jgi:hypothetical protein
MIINFNDINMFIFIIMIFTIIRFRYTNCNKNDITMTNDLIKKINDMSLSQI